MKTSLLMFYYLNDLTMNVQNDIKKHTIARRQSVVAYLPRNVFESKTGHVLHEHCIERSQKVCNIHHAITNVMKPLAFKAASGILCRTKHELFYKITYRNWVSLCRIT